MKKVDIRQTFASNLRAKMKELGMTQAALEARSGVSQGHISDILRGTTKVSLDLAADLAYALKCEVWELTIDAAATRQNILSKLLGVEDPPRAPEVTPRPREEDPAGKKPPKKAASPRPDVGGAE
jgi:transcriptional regulator with XRE-family HTH domain